MVELVCQAVIVGTVTTVPTIPAELRAQPSLALEETQGLGFRDANKPLIL
jgi:hypothetical protein